MAAQDIVNSPQRFYVALDDNVIVGIASAHVGCSCDPGRVENFTVASTISNEQAVAESLYEYIATELLGQARDCDDLGRALRERQRW